MSATARARPRGLPAARPRRGADRGRDRRVAGRRRRRRHRRPDRRRGRDRQGRRRGALPVRRARRRPARRGRRRRSTVGKPLITDRAVPTASAAEPGSPHRRPLPRGGARRLGQRADRVRHRASGRAGGAGAAGLPSGDGRTRRAPAASTPATAPARWPPSARDARSRPAPLRHLADRAPARPRARDRPRRPDRHRPGRRGPPRDVEAAVGPRRPARPPAQPSPPLPAPVGRPSAGETCASRCRGVRRAIADKLSRSRREIPEATIWVDVDATGAAARRARRSTRPRRTQPVGAAGPAGPVLRRRAAARSRSSTPASTPSAARSSSPPHVNLGFAAQTDRGLVVPGRPRRPAADHRRAGRRARPSSPPRPAPARSPPADLTGGTFTAQQLRRLRGRRLDRRSSTTRRRRSLGVGPDHRQAVGGRRAARGAQGDAADAHLRPPGLRRRRGRRLPALRRRLRREPRRTLAHV